MASARIFELPYCGAPPDPAAIWTHWRLDPVVLGVLLGCWLLYVAGRARLVRNGPAAAGGWRSVAFHSGWVIATLALVSPLCPLSVSLFAARAAQHVVLTLVAAPLIAAASPWNAMFSALHVEPSWRARARSGAGRALSNAPLLAAGAFAALVWTWHAPGPYALTFSSVPLYWLMHLSLFASALWLWTALLHGAQTSVPAGLLASVASSVQMGLLGALITLSPRPFYAPHFLTTEAWGYTPLQDQQLGGVIMWVPGCTVFLVVAMIVLARCLAGSAQRDQRTGTAAARAAGVAAQ